MWFGVSHRVYCALVILSVHVRVHACVFVVTNWRSRNCSAIQAWGTGEGGGGEGEWKGFTFNGLCMWPPTRSQTAESIESHAWPVNLSQNCSKHSTEHLTVVVWHGYTTVYNGTTPCTVPWCTCVRGPGVAIEVRQ